MGSFMREPSSWEESRGCCRLQALTSRWGLRFRGSRTWVPVCIFGYNKKARYEAIKKLASLHRQVKQVHTPQLYQWLGTIA